MKKRLSLLLLFLLLASLASAQDVNSFERNITVKTLTNGLTVLIYERHEAPVFSFFTQVDAGSAQDPTARTGLAHMFEHMAFKGTTTIGTKDYAAEKVADLEKAWKEAVKNADQYVVNNQFGQIVESQGGEGMNAFTDYDETAYH